MIDREHARSPGIRTATVTTTIAKRSVVAGAASPESATVDAGDAAQVVPGRGGPPVIR